MSVTFKDFTFDLGVLNDPGALQNLHTCLSAMIKGSLGEKLPSYEVLKMQ